VDQAADQHQAWEDDLSRLDELKLLVGGVGPGEAAVQTWAVGKNIDNQHTHHSKGNHW
jgi:hypothetical protein